MLGRSSGNTVIGCLPTQALAFLAVFVYATHATQAIAFEWKPGLILRWWERWPTAMTRDLSEVYVQARRSHQLTLTIYGYTPMTSWNRLSTEFPVLACGHVLVRSSWESYGCCLTRASVRRTFALVLMRGRYSVWPKVSARYHAMTSHVNNRAYIAHLHTALQISFITLYKARNTRLIYAYYICYLSIRKFSSNNLKMIFFDSLPRELRNQPICKILSSAVK